MCHFLPVYHLGIAFWGRAEGQNITMVDTGATSHIIRDIERFKNFDDSFQPDNHFIELADGTKTNGVALKRGDAEICLVNANGNTESVTFKEACNG